MKRIVTTATWFGALLIPLAAAAHPDHASGGDYGLMHFVTSPFHMGLTGAALLLFVVMRRSMQRGRAASRRVR